ncbi:electron-transfer flavoprotein:ubiquinone oxidoreductase [Conexibacter stalactiti]|uniref:Electron transfer flavoprotein-ubiquinone oxidoreductase n=1 Tax=Conexibacter stalactiti TaxID=1940611 RepID=A0ABU4HVD0_9ACTN|nr:electron-transfer flavoprotein:ubiquinone oxidoreductase [Conexibacter stalactiti]MDW5596647.1 electron-transfer flavoprotein:ubiquinone oxidoreductase [Conexibacter stalactiti]MEC5037289.1 electron-transfer flavoprotein:ubiquinone oxidoreductase [Conexibacter stalactiti]
MAGSSNGRVVPAAYPPPVDSPREFIKRGLDGEDELIEVGVAIVGGGTAGLAAANRLLQLLADDPELLESLGEVPVAVLEKAKTCGGHTLSGAVVRPGPLQELYPDLTREDWRKEGFAFGEVHKEAVYMLPSAKSKIKIPPPPPFKNHGNEVISVAALARYQQRVAEEQGAYILTETAATQLIVEEGRVVGVRSGDKGRGKDGEPLGNFEPGTDIKARYVILAEGCWGSLTGAAIREFELDKDREPPVWELGVKEVWKVPRPLDRLIHTIGPWPLKISARYGQIGGTWIYPMKDERTGDDLVSIGFVVDLEYADATTSAHDLLQQFKLHPLVRGILEGGERVAWGAKALPGGGYWSMPKLTMPGALMVGDAGGMVDTVSLKGVHHCISSGKIAGEVIFDALKRGDDSIEVYEEKIENSVTGRELYEVRNTRQPFQKGFLMGGPIVNLAIATKGKLPPGRLPWHKNDEKGMFIGNTADGYPRPDNRYTFDKLSSVFITGNATRDDAPNHIRVQRNVPREIAETWKWMCPAGVYELPEDAPERGNVDVIVNYTNCVQCGAITAKGGRLTTPEGGDGPLYTIT